MSHLPVHRRRRVRGRLPGISALQEEYDVPSAGTIRQAQEILVHEGLIRTEQGSGAWVVALAPKTDIMAELLELRARIDRVIAAYARESA
ncbi:GntR family transcriptional regulator [Kribbella sp. NPDC049584]|uniref:GntR family transcriptional regulator n=1 Tax=Kribbella sp. NPDC049584 TaxID=3154833 RepID=UPI003441C7DF